ncbi:MAG TPA: hypothetical protein PKV02_12270 [Bacteroidia bacterium]|nr:hypothetical protein [Bacteroidia bacterium]
MKRQLIISAFLILSCYSCKKDEAIIEPEPNDTTIHNDLIAGGGVTSFQRIIGGQKLDGLYSVKQTSDGGYTFCGFTENDGASERDIFLIRTNANGETVWIKKFSDSYTDQGWFVEITSDNGFILATTSNLAPSSSTNHNYSGQLIKTDASGNQTWKQTFTFGNYTNFSTVIQTNDGGYIACGTDYYSNKGILLKTDAFGTESWRKTYGGIVEINNINKTSDGGLIMCGSVKTTFSSPTDIYIIRTNTTGDTIWTKTYGDASDNTARAIKETPSGNFILCGYNTNPGASGYAKLIDNNGGQIWHTDFLSSNVQALDNITTTNDNQFIAVGRNSFGNGNQALLLKIDNSGNSVWLKWFNPRNYNLFNEVQQTNDSGFVIAGYTFGDGYVVKTDGNGN